LSVEELPKGVATAAAVKTVHARLREEISSQRATVPKYSTGLNRCIANIERCMIVQDSLEEELFVPFVACATGSVINSGLWTSTFYEPEGVSEAIVEPTDMMSNLHARKRLLAQCLESGQRFIVTCYNDFESEAEWEAWRADTFKLSTVHDMTGIVEVFESEVLEGDEGLQPELPILHLIQTEPACMVTPAFSGSFAAAHSELLEWLAKSFGDSIDGKLAAEALVLALIAKPSLRVNGLVDSLFIGKFALNVAVQEEGPQSVTALLALLKALCPQVAGPLAVNNLPENAAFNSVPIYPQMDAETSLLSVSMLQQPEGTPLLVDETGLGVGEFKDQAVRNLQAVVDLIRHQQIPFDFGMQQVLIKADMPVIAVSGGKSILPNDCSVSVPFVSVPEEPAPLQARAYVAACRSGSCVVGESMAGFLESDYLLLRKERPQDFDEQEFHRLINIARLRAISQGMSELSESLWSETKGMFMKR
jgi:hypothetical protein